MREVYITRVSSFLPNRVVENDNMEQYLGLIGDKPSRTRSIVLRQNGIKKRYYALNEKQQITHSNAQLAKEAVVKLFVDNKIPKEISLLSCAQALLTNGFLHTHLWCMENWRIFQWRFSLRQECALPLCRR